MKKVNINRKRHIAKAITWNLLAMSTTYIVLLELPPFFDLQPISKSGAGFLVAVDRVLKLVFYYFHETTWTKSSWGEKK